jgi:predicted acyltransferase (DUF342 family)
MKRLVIATFGLVVASVPAARAGDMSCGATMTGGTVKGDLLVPAGTTCTLNGVTVGGNVLVGPSATLDVGTGSKIGGNINAAECFSVELYGNAISVSGNVRIEACSGQSGFEVTPSDAAPGITIDGNFTCTNNPEGCVVRGGEVRGNVSLRNNVAGQIFSAWIGGNLQVAGNSSGGESAAISLNTVAGNVEVSDNSAPGGALAGGNTIGGNLECHGNTPGVSDDGNGANKVGGNKLGQCAGL